MQEISTIRSLLRSGDRRTVTKVSEVVEMVLRNLDLLPALVECLFDEDAAVRMRAADALEKVSRERTDEMQIFTPALLDLFEETRQQEVLWHLAVILPRLRLSAASCCRTAEALQSCLDSRGSIVKALALQGLSDLTVQDPPLRPLVIDLLRTAERSGTPAMKARSRKLLRKLERQEKGD